MRVLLIEDDKMVGAAVELALKDAAYAVDWVTDGRNRPSMWQRTRNMRSHCSILGCH